MSAVRTTRDWRDIRFKCHEMESFELMEVLLHAMSAEEQLQAFMREIGTAARIGDI